MQLVFDYLKEHEVEYKRNFKLSDISSFKIGGYADIFASPANQGELVSLVNFLEKNEIQYKILGRATNVLFSDNGFRGVIISTRKLSRIEFSGTLCHAECGASLTSLVNSAAEIGLGGLENLVGIPAAIGGAVYNNAGAYGSCIEDALISARVYDLSSERILTLERADMDFEYRKSILHKGALLLLSSSFCLKPTESALAHERIELAREKRRTYQPTLPSLGSTFKREGAIPISRLIDELGLKGIRVGGAEVSQKHAGFIVNRGDATASDVLALIEIIKNKIFEAYGFVPTEEIEILS